MEMFPEASECVVKVASSGLDKEELVRKIIALNEKGDVVQLFDPKQVRGGTHLVGAYVNALNAFNEKTSISKNVATEMLLFAAMTRQINDAIKKMGIKSTKDFVVFASSEEAYRKAKKLFTDEKKFVSKNDGDTDVLREMAVARLSG